MTRAHLFALLAAITLSASLNAEEAVRVWVDASGRFAIEAALVEVQRYQVILADANGQQTTVAIDMLSLEDQKYLRNLRSKTDAAVNRLRNTPPPAPQFAAQPTIDLPAADHTAADGSVLSHKGQRLRGLNKRPFRLMADPAPIKLGAAATRISIRRVDVNDICSRPIPMVTRNESGIRSTSIVMSVSDQASYASPTIRNHLIRFIPESQQTIVTLKHNQSIRLLDHHHPSGRSLVLVGFNSLGQGGELAVASDWDRDRVRLRHRRALAETTELSRLPHLRWARWIDEEHVLAVIDRTLGLWNVTSGKQLYAVRGIDSRGLPALSGGRRYVAVPREGGVAMFRTTDGAALGWIAADKHKIPGVSFSPAGNSLAVVTSRRLYVWDLPSATIASETNTRRSLGTQPPIWIDSDLVLTSNGLLVSTFRGLPLWRYEIAGTEGNRVGRQVALFRRYPESELSIVSLPHPIARQAIEQFDRDTEELDASSWRVLGRSSWNRDGWLDRDVRVATSGSRQTSSR